MLADVAVESISTSYVAARRQPVNLEGNNGARPAGEAGAYASASARQTSRYHDCTAWKV
jgi:hypothetical protein